MVASPTIVVARPSPFVVVGVRIYFYLLRIVPSLFSLAVSGVVEGPVATSAQSCGWSGVRRRSAFSDLLGPPFALGVFLRLSQWGYSTRLS